jgi:FkbM family methyltransferase
VYVQFEWVKNKKINTIVDIGAHEGKVTKVLHHFFPNAMIYAFEPNKNLHNNIRKTIAAEKIQIESLAVSNKVQKQKFYQAKETTLSSLMELSSPGIREGIPIEIETSMTKTTTLDEYFKSKKLKKNIFLKIDTEGAEGLILQGGSKFLKKVAIIHIETYYSKIYKNQSLFEDIYKTLVTKGFTYAGEAQESYFYPNFNLRSIANSVFIRK